MKIKGYEPNEQNNTITKIDKWYDRHARMWCIQCKNSEGDQVGDAFYSDKKGAQIEYDRLMREYNYFNPLVITTKERYCK